MARRCDLTDIGPMSGHNVSHSNAKTKRRFEPNLCNVTMVSQILGKKYKLRITAATLRTVDFKGGFDEFLLNTKNKKLSEKGKKIRREIIKKQAEVETEAA